MRKVWIGPLGLILIGPLLFLATDTAGDTLNVATTGPDLTSTNATIEVVVPGANFPVALAFAPDGRLFYTEHCTGNVRIVAADDQLMAQPFANVEVPACGDWGLTGLALDPDFESNHYVYVHYMEEVTSDPLVTRPVVKRFTEVANVGTNPTVIHTGPQTDPTKARHHAANEIHFGPDGYLYVSAGDLRKEDVLISQDLSALEGKILRLNKADGLAPPDNPFVGTPGADPRIYAYGFRNSFGFTFHDEGGGLFATENGPDRCDELNLIVAGGNYGWPIPYEESSCDVPVGIQPIFWFTFFLWDAEWEPNNTASPVGIDYIDGDTYPILGDSLLVCQWRNGKMRYIALGGPGQEEVVDDGLVTFDGEQITDCSLDVEVGPTGAIYYSNATSIKRILVDSDSDTVIDGSDNCPAWPNADQSLPPWAIPPGDPDCDGFTTDAENFMGTEPKAACAGTATDNDEGPPDAWPVDADDNQFVNLLDVLPMKQHFNTTDPDPDYNPRFDLKDQNGTINLFDVLPYKAFFLTSCAP
jgi:glucose/arabinose dehydrogenase